MDGSHMVLINLANGFDIYFELRTFAMSNNSIKEYSMVSKDGKIDEFISAMFSMASAIKNESEHCCMICGDVNEKELMILVFVGQNGSVKMSEIAENLQAPLSTLTSIVDKLVANKLLMRFNSEEDRRVVKVALADRGKEAFKVFLGQKQIMAKKVLGRFSEKEQTALVGYLTKLASAITSKK